MEMNAKPQTAPPIPTEAAVHARYARAAQTPEASLCCAVSYDPKLLEAIPREVIDKDYGCGDPSRYLTPGQTVLDLGSGTGKICFIAAQVVGAKGRVIGVDMTDEMLEVARRHAPEVARRIGYSNVEFRKGRIQDLALDVELFDRALQAQPVSNFREWTAMEQLAERLRRSSPLIPDESVDAVVSNCVLNLVEPRSKILLFAEIFRVLRPGGRAVISDIVASQPVPLNLQQDPELWSGCISGALPEDRFLRSFEAAGFPAVRVLERSAEPWRVVEKIEFRSVTVEAIKSSIAPVFAPLPLPRLNSKCCG